MSASSRKMRPLLLALLLGAAAVPFLASCAGAPPAGLPPAATYTVSGTARTADGAPIAVGSVLLSGTPRGVFTDDAGRFTLSRVRPGRYGLVVVHLGYRSAEQRIVVPGPGAEEVRLSMRLDRELATALGAALPDSMPPIALSYDIRPGS